MDAYEQEPDWTSFGPGYVDAISYAYATLSGYLRATADRDRILIVLGDHQPPAAVSGEGAPWDVPVHVIVRTGSAPDRSRILDRLVARGFRAGVTPRRPALGRMHTLLPVLLDAFSDERKITVGTVVRPNPGDQETRSMLCSSRKKNLLTF